MCDRCVVQAQNDQATDLGRNLYKLINATSRVTSSVRRMSPRSAYADEDGDAAPPHEPDQCNFACGASPTNFRPKYDHAFSEKIEC